MRADGGKDQSTALVLLKLFYPFEKLGPAKKGRQQVMSLRIYLGVKKNSQAEHAM